LFIVITWLFCGLGLYRSAISQNRPLIAGALTATSSPERIVSLAPNLTEILFALGLDDKIVGVPLHSNYPPAAANKPKTGTFWQPNIEAVIAAKPDLVITLGFEQQKNIAERLKRIGYKTLTVNIEKVTDFFEAVGIIGQAAGKVSQANQLTSNLRNKLDNIRSLFTGVDRPKVLYVVQRQPLRVAGTDTFVNEMIELAGGKNAIGRTIHKYPPIGAELVYTCGADVIIEPTMDKDNSLQQRQEAIKYWARFQTVPAVRDERIYIIDGDLVCRLGPRLDEAVETIAKCLRPKLFEN